MTTSPRPADLTDEFLQELSGLDRETLLSRVQAMHAGPGQLYVAQQLVLAIRQGRYERLTEVGRALIEAVNSQLAKARKTQTRGWVGEGAYKDFCNQLDAVLAEGSVDDDARVEELMQLAAKALQCAAMRHGPFRILLHRLGNALREVYREVRELNNVLAVLRPLAAGIRP